MKKHLTVLGLLSLMVFNANAQETIKETTISTANSIERKDSVALDQQEPKKKDSSAEKKDSKSEGQNKMAINEQGVNKVKPKTQKSSSKTQTEKKDKSKEEKK